MVFLTCNIEIVRTFSLLFFFFFSPLLKKSRWTRCGMFSSLGAIVQELCESRGGRSGLSVLTSLLVSVDVKNY